MSAHSSSQAMRHCAFADASQPTQSHKLVHSTPGECVALRGSCVAAARMPTLELTVTLHHETNQARARQGKRRGRSGQTLERRGRLPSSTNMDADKRDRRHHHSYASRSSSSSSSPSSTPSSVSGRKIVNVNCVSALGSSLTSFASSSMPTPLIFMIRSSSRIPQRAAGESSTTSPTSNPSVTNASDMPSDSPALRSSTMSKRPRAS
mmetsp:Transcript_22056/g.49792  ORF Transcript_22056/g.49792 Transcript_22056/m.49792 type:complete len:207 (+) Transcript_22056:296-916(+)